MTNNRVLFVDDDPIARGSFARAMRQRGFIVDVAKDGEEAWQLANHFPYAVIATDLRMPGLDGLMLIEQLRELQPDPVCMLVTGVAQLDWYGDDPESRGIRVIRKPWNGDQLADALRAAFEQYHERSLSDDLDSEGPQTEVGLRLLLIEDNDDDAERIVELVRSQEHCNYLVSRSDSREHSLLLLKRYQYDVCLLDVGIGTAQAAERVSELLKQRPTLPIVVVSSVESDDSASRAMNAGAQDYLCREELNGRTLPRAIRYAIERKRADERLKFLVQHDDLTKLANRAQVHERLAQSVARARDKKLLAGVIFLDLDRFKGVIDSLGHHAGDELLRQVAERLKGCVRETDTVGRLGGDEFAIVLDELARVDVATAMAQRVLNAFATPYRLGNHEVVTTASVGVALYPDNGLDTDQLMKNADLAMYRAKDAGRNNYQYFGEDLHRRAIERLCLEADLRRAIEKEEFVVYYQPKLNLAENRITGAEALIRWKQPDGKLVPPFEFIPILEETGLIVPVGEWVLRKALEDLAAIRNAGFSDFSVAVNVSAVQFESEDFMESVKRAIAETRVPENALELEITEGVLMRDNDRTRRAMDTLRKLNVRLSIDDFGTGYCTLVCLKRFPVQALKIDRSFVKDITTDPDDAAIASAVVALAHSLGLEVVAEGVEELEHLEFLRKLGCEYIQGYYVSRPRPLDEFMQLIAAHPGSKRSTASGARSIGSYSTASSA